MSPIYSLGELASTATTFAGRRSDCQLSEASRYVNLAMFELASKIGHTPREAIAVSSTTSGEQRIALPPDYDYATAVTMFVASSSTATTSRHTNVVTLTPRDATWLDAQPLASGEPQAYDIYAGSMELYPSPNSAYSLQLRYMAKVQTLVQSNETPGLDERWHPAILYKTVELLEASRNNPEGESRARDRYLAYVAVTPTDIRLKQMDRRGMSMRFSWRKPS